MIEITPFLEMVLVLGATVAPIVVAIRLLAGWTDPFDGAARVAPATWPKGVQEEEPRPWRFGAAAG
jgi:hypothetical protein